MSVWTDQTNTGTSRFKFWQDTEDATVMPGEAGKAQRGSGDVTEEVFHKSHLPDGKEEQDLLTGTMSSKLTGKPSDI